MLKYVNDKWGQSKIDKWGQSKIKSSKYFILL
jgi:hypothetical protein